jgi:hypothetical protein
VPSSSVGAGVGWTEGAHRGRSPASELQLVVADAGRGSFGGARRAAWRVSEDHNKLPRITTSFGGARRAAWRISEEPSELKRTGARTAPAERAPASPRRRGRRPSAHLPARRGGGTGQSRTSLAHGAGRVRKAGSSDRSIDPPRRSAIDLPRRSASSIDLLRRSTSSSHRSGRSCSCGCGCLRSSVDGAAPGGGSCGPWAAAERWRRELVTAAGGVRRGSVGIPRRRTAAGRPDAKKTT